MQTIKWIAAVFIGAGIGAGVTATAGPGDLVYEDPDVGGEVCITQAQAVCYADCAIAAGVWTGARTDMINTKAYRASGCAEGFAATVHGLKSAPAGSLPVTENGVRVVGVVE